MQEFLRQSAAWGGPIIVLDLEMTAWEGSLAAKWSRPGEYKEIVQNRKLPFERNRLPDQRIAVP